ncbi:MAG TPA: hypothetical protein VGX03_25470 [Candidatus Binatia bacterium]|nr:hypothetical protein [Candidatus Binatia bacterium]
MTNTLTAAGIKLCMALITGTPTYEACVGAFARLLPPCDFSHVCPAELWASPDSLWSKEQEKGWECVILATYDIIDGSTGTERLCTRPASLYWIPGTSLWRWKIEEK